MKNKYTAFILALFLGWLGFHKFYLGKWIQGILYIIFMPIALVISIFEAFTYLLNSKEWFDVNFNAEYIRNKEIYDRNK